MADAASMRPRHYAAENRRHGRWIEAQSRFNEAAALRRGKRTFGIEYRRLDGILASMRPRHYAAENTREIRQASPSPPGFNEAAALRRGKPEPRGDIRDRPGAASMRPRHYAAENAQQWRSVITGLTPASMRPRHYAAENVRGGAAARSPPLGRFNEAAALRRGKLLHRTGHIPAACFNEAAALRRGKRRQIRTSAGQPGKASMRPRHYAVRTMLQ